MKKNKNIFKVVNNILVIVLILSLFYLIYTGVTVLPKIDKLNHQYQEALIINEQYIEKQEIYNNFTPEEKRKMAEEKARQDGYAYPDEKIFYNIN